MKSERNAYVTPLKCAYVVIDHQRLWNDTFYTPIKD